MGIIRVQKMSSCVRTSKQANTSVTHLESSQETDMMLRFDEGEVRRQHRRKRSTDRKRTFTAPLTQVLRRRDVTIESPLKLQQFHRNGHWQKFEPNVHGSDQILAALLQWPLASSYVRCGWNVEVIVTTFKNGRSIPSSLTEFGQSRAGLSSKRVYGHFGFCFLNDLGENIPMFRAVLQATWFVYSGQTVSLV